MTNEYTNEVMPDSAWCAVPWNEDAKTPFYLMISSTVVAFIIPFSLVTVLYYKEVIIEKNFSIQIFSFLFFYDLTINLIFPLYCNHMIIEDVIEP